MHVWARAATLLPPMPLPILLLPAAWQHPHVVRLEGVFEDAGRLFIVTELVEGGELFDRIVGRPRFTEAEARGLMRPLVEAVAYLHVREAAALLSPPPIV